MTIHGDPSVDYEADPRRALFVKLCEAKDIEGLKRLIGEFIAAGHNPKDPTDSMFQILGITPEFLALTLFSIDREAKVHIPAFEEAVEPPPPEPDISETLEPEPLKA